MHPLQVAWIFGIKDQSMRRIFNLHTMTGEFETKEPEEIHFGLETFLLILLLKTHPFPFKKFRT